MLTEVVIPVKGFSLFLVKLMARPEITAQGQAIIPLGKFVNLMDDIGFYGRSTAAFDMTFRPFFAKRAFAGKGKGGNIQGWKHYGRIDFRQPFPRDRFDIGMLRIMLSRLGDWFQDNGLRVRLVNYQSLKEEQNGEHRRTRRTESDPLPANVSASAASA